MQPTVKFKFPGMQQGPTVQHREVHSTLCGRLDGRGVWARMDTCMCMAESLCCVPETITTLLSVTCAHVQSCPTFCNPMDCNPPGSSIHGIFQARMPFPMAGSLCWAPETITVFSVGYIPI